MKTQIATLLILIAQLNPKTQSQIEYFDKQHTSITDKTALLYKLRFHFDSELTCALIVVQSTWDMSTDSR